MVNILFFGVLAFLAFYLLVYVPFCIISWLFFDSTSGKKKAFKGLMALIVIPVMFLPVAIIWLIASDSPPLEIKIASIIGIVGVFAYKPVCDFGTKHELFD